MARGDYSPIDVVIPVYNAPQLTRRCIDSLYEQVEPQLGTVLVQDDASDLETAGMLDSLQHPRLSVEHADRNQGFGAMVNRGIARAKSELVLVLNSDVEARSGFLEPLLEVMAREPRLASVSPAGNQLAGHDLGRYRARAGLVQSQSIYGYAFLVRRAAFQGVGGFDPVFGRGYFEDIDLSRRLVEAGWWMGVHPRAELHHELHGSFEAGNELDALFARNRDTYFSRHPQARRQVLLISGRAELDVLAEGPRAELDKVLSGGGGVHWLARRTPAELHSLPMRGARLGLLSGLRLLRRRQGKEYKRFTELWLADDAPPLARALLGGWSRRHGLEIRDLRGA